MICLLAAVMATSESALVRNRHPHFLSVLVPLLLLDPTFDYFLPLRLEIYFHNPGATIRGYNHRRRGIKKRTKIYADSLIIEFINTVTAHLKSLSFACGEVEANHILFMHSYRLSAIEDAVKL